MATKNWIVQISTGAREGWSDSTSSDTRSAARTSLASNRGSQPQFKHRLVYREIGCPDAVMPD